MGEKGYVIMKEDNMSGDRLVRDVVVAAIICTTLYFSIKILCETLAVTKAVSSMQLQEATE